MKNDAFLYDARYGTPDGIVPPAADVDDCVRRHAPLVRRLARRLVARLPANVEFDDMLQAGMIGLMDAASRYEPGQGTPFETYATQRIRGAMLDELRAGDWLPRSARRVRRDIDAAIHRLQGRLGRAPVESEVAAELGLALSDYHALARGVCAPQLVSLDDLDGGADDEELEESHAPGAGGEPAALLDEKRMHQAVAAAIDRLPERERILMKLYHEQELNLREIGARLGVTESRVCQLHSQAIARLRTKLKEW